MSDSDIKKYLSQIQKGYKTGIATEHSYRGYLQECLTQMLPNGVITTNEPKQIKCGAPDYVITRNNIPLRYIEAKDIDKELNDKAHNEQLNRYTESLDNLIFTNYLEFQLFRDGKKVTSVSIAELNKGKITPKEENFEKFSDMLRSFVGYQGQTIRSAKELAKHMAAKDRMLKQVIENALAPEMSVSESSKDLQTQLQVFKDRLIPDLEPSMFADIYSQTLAYGMFAARLHDSSTQTFTRQQAAELIPKSNPFLRQFFQHIAGYELDTRIRWIVDELAALFQATNVAELMSKHGQSTQRKDPFLHFYETFLGEYDSKMRKVRGVYYTPEPIVNFIVKSVDYILREEFKLPKGISDKSKISVKNKATKEDVVFHKVQILDPATGTGTFLSEIVKYIREKYFVNQKGIWSDYTSKDLIPRLNGFELLMAPYAMAHTKLEMELRSGEFELDENQRLQIYLTNALEKQDIDKGELLARWLAEEAKGANSVKEDVPVMVVIGNPPYSGESSNKGEWISNLIEVYKKEPDGGKLQEKNPKWLNDDYVKFIRYGQHYIDETGEGILAFINNHSYLDNPTFRGMRYQLLQSFDKIYIIDLHGNSKKKETSPDGLPDKNVFDIQQGVVINLFVKTGNKSSGELAKVLHFDLYGSRESKYQFLWDRSFNAVQFKEIYPQSPAYFFVPRDYKEQEIYDSGFSIKELFPIHSAGVVTARDKLTIHQTQENLKLTAAEFSNLDIEKARTKFSLPADAKDWKIQWAQKDLKDGVFGEQGNDDIVPINYRPFDKRYTYYTGKTKGFHCRPRKKVMKHFICGQNTGLVFIRRARHSDTWKEIFVTNNIISGSTSISSLDINYVCPLYCYSDTKQKSLTEGAQRVPNIDKNIVKSISKRLDMHFTPEKEDDPETFAPLDLLDYIYAVLHTPSYRTRYEEFLKSDFPRVPYPADKKFFHRLVKLGGQLRTLHLFESDKLDTLITRYPETGDNRVTRSISKDDYEITNAEERFGKVWINDTQYLENVPETAWNAHIGGYQPAQKWLKDRRDCELTSDDVIHYQKIIVALVETDTLMQKIDQEMEAILPD